MNCIDPDLFARHAVTIEDIYQGAFQIKMKAEELSRQKKDPTRLYQSEYRLICALSDLKHGPSMLLMGELLQGGKIEEIRSIPERIEKAVLIWEEAACLGQPTGLTNIGLLYLHKTIPGGGDDHGEIPYDPEKAFSYLVKAYEAGDSKAGRHIGLCYRDGIGVEKDPEKAYDYFDKAAARNDSTAKYLKAECLYYGHGVEKDENTAISIMEQLISENAHDADKAKEFLSSLHQNI